MTEPLHARLREAAEVRVVTTAADGRRHRTIVWVVVDADGRILVRSYRGPNARWYRDATSGRPMAVEIGGEDHTVRAERAADEERIRACSRELAAKYAGESETPAMLRPEVLDTTLELVPLSG